MPYNIEVRQKKNYNKEMQPQPCRSPPCPLQVPHHQTWARCASHVLCCQAKGSLTHAQGFQVRLDAGSGWAAHSEDRVTIPLYGTVSSWCLSNSLAIMHVITVWTYSLWIRRASYKMAVSQFRYKRVTRCKQEHSYVPHNSLTLRQSRI